MRVPANPIRPASDANAKPISVSLFCLAPVCGNSSALAEELLLFAEVLVILEEIFFSFLCLLLKTIVVALGLVVVVVAAVLVDLVCFAFSDSPRGATS
nr:MULTISPECIES: hypothetical protein [Lactobacillus]